MTDIPLPDRPKRYQPLDGQREHERMSVGSFFAENKAIVDARRHELARVGMLPQHTMALRMPEPMDAPLPVVGEPAIPPMSIVGPTVDAAPEEAAPGLDGYAPKKLPAQLEGML